MLAVNAASKKFFRVVSFFRCSKRILILRNSCGCGIADLLILVYVIFFTAMFSLQSCYSVLPTGR